MYQLYPFKLYLKYRPHLIILGIALLFHIGIWVWLLGNIRNQDEQIFLHYNILFGVDLYGAWWRLLLLPITGLVILLVNGALGWVLFQKDKFIASMLNVTSLICQIFLLIGAALLVFLNV